MEEKKRKRLQYCVLICKQKHRDKFLKLLADHGAQGMETIYGKGSANTGLLAQALGFEGEISRAILSALIPTERAEVLFRELTETHAFDKKNTGFAFTIPVDGLLF